ncbi:MAG: UDP-glucose/GDP-mannose dehydrogenase family protein, partial [Salinisphaeraceae bacterium]|nr:UDP-glucose/GDP-mannose dehydrogenase family protein [Salinisphaeraceae bacterium]
MRISLFGAGYVGLVTGLCLAEDGHQVAIMDTDKERVRKLANGELPIYEPGLEDLLENNLKQGRVRFVDDVNAAVTHGDVLFITVGTPPDEDGSADLRHVLAVAQSIGQEMIGYKLVVTKSTVPVGTADRVRRTIGKALLARGLHQRFDVASNPEFLKEGSAVSDFRKPDRIVVGVDTERAGDTLRQLYSPYNRRSDRMLVMDIRSAELTKYAANAMLATRISFMNEIAGIAEQVGADVEAVRAGIGSDPRIGNQFLYAGCGFGGSCFPKDVRALAATAKEHQAGSALLDTTLAVNDRQQNVLFERLSQHFGDLRGRCIALWGLAFKPNTDDIREAPARRLMESLWEAGAIVQAHDPEAMPAIADVYGPRDDLKLCENEYAVLNG